MGYHSIGWVSGSNYWVSDFGNQRSPTGTLTMQNNVYTIIINERDSHFRTNGILYSYDDSCQAMVVRGRVFVPLHNILESIGCQVSWNQITGVISIFTHPSNYTITFDCKGDELTPDERTRTVTPLSTITLPYLTREGYTFMGWYTDEQWVFKIGDGGEQYFQVTYSAKISIFIRALTCIFQNNML